MCLSMLHCKSVQSKSMKLFIHSSVYYLQICIVTNSKCFLAVVRCILWISGKKDRLFHWSWKSKCWEISFKQVQRASEKCWGGLLEFLLYSTYDCWVCGESGSGRPYLEIFVIIMAYLSSCHVTCQVISTQNNLFNIVQPSILRKTEKKKPDSDTNWGDEQKPRWITKFVLNGWRRFNV